MSDDHELQVFEEEALAGRAANVRAWKAYFAAFPRYQIEPQNVAEQGSQVAILGSTVGSHLQLPPEVERGMTLIWLS